LAKSARTPDSYWALEVLALAAGVAEYGPLPQLTSPDHPGRENSYETFEMFIGLAPSRECGHRPWRADHGKEAVTGHAAVFRRSQR